jgi:hydrogenase maturation factor
MESKEIVTINGVKFEVDLAKMRRITEYKVGDAVKVLKKEYSDTWASYPGVIVGFDPFENLPTIVVAFIKVEYSACKLEYLYFNSNSKDAEICQVTEGQYISLEKSRILDLMDQEIAKKELELQESKLKKEHFLKRFNSYFEREGQEAAVQ